MPFPYIFLKKIAENEIRQQIETIQYKYQLKTRTFDDSDYVWQLAKFHLHADEEIKYYFTGNSTFFDFKHHNKIGFKICNTDPEREAQLFSCENDDIGIFTFIAVIFTNKRLIIDANGFEFSIDYPCFLGYVHGAKQKQPIMNNIQYVTIYDEFSFYLLISRSYGQEYKIPIIRFTECNDSQHLYDFLVTEFIPLVNSYLNNKKHNNICPS